MGGVLSLGGAANIGRVQIGASCLLSLSKSVFSNLPVSSACAILRCLANLSPMSDSPEASEFDQYAKGYDDALNAGLRFSGEGKDYFASKRIKWLKRQLENHGSPSSGFSLMDYGCGTGGSIPAFRKEFFPEKIIGVDISKESILLAGQSFTQPNIAFSSIADYHPDASLDVVFCNGVFHHIPPQERDQCVRYIFDSLKPGGVFAFWENNPWNPGTRFIMSRVSFDKDAQTLSYLAGRRLLEQNGFKVRWAHFHFIFPKALSFLRWIEPHLCSLPLGGQYLLFAVKPLR